MRAFRIVKKRHALTAFSGDGARASVRDGQRELVVVHQHAGGQVGEDVLQVRLRCLERGAVGRLAAARVLKLARHGIERLGEHAELVAARDRRLAGEVAARYRLHRLGGGGERRGEQVRLGHGHRDRHWRLPMNQLEPWYSSARWQRCLQSQNPIGSRTSSSSRCDCTRPIRGSLATIRP